MTLYRKLAPLLGFLSLSFLVARLLEVQSGHVSRRPLDAASLPISKLKTVLEWRGVDYEGLFEKSEVQELVEQSGTITQEELDVVTTTVNADFPLTNYSDFEELLEDAKENMWLVEIVSNMQMLLSDASWRAVRSKVGKFGVRFGRFYCRLNDRLCKRNNWYNSRLVLFLPPGNPKRNAKATIHTHSGSIKLKSLFNWIKRKVNTHVHPIKDLKTFHDKWETFDSPLTPELRVVFVSSMPDVPMFLSALRVKFPGRVKIGSIDTNTNKGKQIVREAGISSTPAYVILTPGVTYTYGSRRGEMFIFRAMEIFLKSFYPMFSDLFMISLVLTNIAIVLDTAMVRESIKERLGTLCYNVFKYNGIVMILWIFLAILPTPFDTVCCFALRALRPCAATLLFSLIRIDCMYHIDHPTAALVMAAAIIIIIIMIIIIIIIIIIMIIIMAYIVALVGRWLYPDPVNEGRDLRAVWAGTRRQGHVHNFTTGTYSSGDEGMENDVNHEQQRRHVPAQNGRRQREEVNDSDHDDDHRPGPPIRGPGPPQQNVFDADGNMIPIAYIQHLPCWHFSKSRVTQGNSDVCAGCNHADITLNMRASTPEGYNVDTQCVICQEDYKHIDLLRGVPCGHVFHAKCLWQWLSKGGPSCPNCRAQTN